MLQRQTDKKEYRIVVERGENIDLLAHKRAPLCPITSTLTVTFCNRKTVTGEVEIWAINAESSLKNSWSNHARYSERTERSRACRIAGEVVAELSLWSFPGRGCHDWTGNLFRWWTAIPGEVFNAPSVYVCCFCHLGGKLSSRSVCLLMPIAVVCFVCSACLSKALLINAAGLKCAGRANATGCCYPRAQWCAVAVDDLAISDRTLRFLAFLPDQATSVCLCFPLKNCCRVFESAKHGNATNFSYFYCQSTLKQFTTHNKKKKIRSVTFESMLVVFCVYDVNNVWEVLFMLSLNFCYCISYFKILRYKYFWRNIFYF